MTAPPASDGRQSSTTHLETRPAVTSLPEVLPEPTSSSTAGLFVGRDHELAMFRAAIEAVGRHRTTVLLLSGEPGIGKTRLASEVGGIAAALGFHVHWGRCWEAGGAPAYLPWIEVVRSCMRGTDVASLSKRVAAHAAHLVLLVPELREELPDLPEAETTADLDRARFQLFEGMASFLRAVAEVQPLMVVLDDLHAADHSSVVMLQFLAGHLRDVPLLLIGCYRDTEIPVTSEIGAGLAEIARDAYHVALNGLLERDVEQFIRTIGPNAASPAVVSTVRVVTGGNPFFVGELVRQLEAGSGLGGRLPLPAGVREAVRSRLRRLSDACSELLTVASVVGQEFTLPGLATAADLPSDRVARTLEEALGARVIAERSGAPGHYGFFHGLIREVLYEDLSAGKRAEFHARVGDALERLYGAHGDAHLAALAHHFFMASTHGDTEKAILFCTRAADRALRQLASVEAVEHYGRALQVLALAGGNELRRRCSLLIGRGHALEHVGDFAAARGDFTEAAAIARQVGDAEAFVNAALGCGEQWALKFTCSVVDRSDIVLLEEALRMTSLEPQSRRATILARTGCALFYAGEHERGQQVSAAALQSAEQSGDPEVLARVLSARHAVLLGPDGLAERFRVVDEIARIGAATGNREILLRSHVLRMYNLIERGDVDDADFEMVKIARLVDEIGDPFERWHCTISRSAGALFRGRLAESEHLAREAYDAAQRVPGQQRAEHNAGTCFNMQMIILRREQGRPEQVSAEARALAIAYPSVPGWHYFAAVLELDLGRTERAVECVDALGIRNFSMLPRDSVWLGLMFLLAEVVAGLRDRPRCLQVFEMLAPYAELNATFASPVWLGSTARALGLLAASLGRWDESAALFERAVEWHAQRGALLWLAHTQVDYATMLLERRASGDQRRAAELLGAAEATARTLAAVRLATRVGALEGAIDPRADPCATSLRPTFTRPTTAVHAVFRREGEYWTIADGEHTVRLKHSRGLTMLASLLTRPGHEVHALELVRVANPPPPSHLPRTEIAVDGGDQLSVPRVEVGALSLDRKARAAYRARLSELRAERDDAERSHDTHRAHRAQAEIEQLAAELKRDHGLGGGQRSGTRAERARLNVTRAIRSAIGRIENAHPSHGAHFRLAVRTGTFCAYVPEPTSTIVWDA